MRPLAIFAGISLLLVYGIYATVFRFSNPDMTDTRLFLEMLPWNLVAPIAAFVLVFIGWWE